MTFSPPKPVTHLITGTEPGAKSWRDLWALNYYVELSVSTWNPLIYIPEKQDKKAVLEEGP